MIKPHALLHVLRLPPRKRIALSLHLLGRSLAVVIVLAFALATASDLIAHWQRLP